MAQIYVCENSSFSGWVSFRTENYAAIVSLNNNTQMTAAKGVSGKCCPICEKGENKLLFWILYHLA